MRNFFGSLMSIPLSNAPKRDINGQQNHFAFIALEGITSKTLGDPVVSQCVVPEYCTWNTKLVLSSHQNLEEGALVYCLKR